MKEIKKILVTGACGQIGSELTPALRKRYGADNVIPTDIRKPEGYADELFGILDVTNYSAIEEYVKRHNIDTIIHLAAILSGTGEQNPVQCWNINMTGTLNMLELARSYNMARLFIPSSIAVWGPGVPAKAPQETTLKPTSMYGVTKVAGEVLCDYYVNKYKVDCRGVRYPGIISSETLPGGGTTDYAVEIYYEAIKNKYYKCFLSESTKLPMMYMPDCIKAAMDLLEADFSKLKHHSDFNVGSMSFSPKEIYIEIKKHIPDFKIEYSPDFRQSIADSWPDDVEDISAREEWGWSPSYNIEAMTTDMLKKLAAKLKK